jgi:hypothetical protein
MASVQVHLNSEQDRKLKMLKAIFEVSTKEKALLELINRFKIDPGAMR